MGASRTLLRKLDSDLIAQIEASGKVQKPPKKKPLLRKPRNGESYRGARRNATRPTGAIMVRLAENPKERPFDGSIELNRSKRWVRCKDYSYAREIGPSLEPVR